MIPLAFDLELAESADHAVALLVEHGEDAKLLAGGHSLIPLLKLRLAAPTVLVDISRLDDLRFIEDIGDVITIGALTRHRDLETSGVLAEHAPLLAHVASKVGDPQVRNRGTIGGSLAHGDAASDLPAAALALRATMVVQGSQGRREVPADEFFFGFLETAVGEDEMLIEIRVPKATGCAWSYQKLSRRSQDYAIVGVAAVATPQPGVALVNMSSRPMRARAVEAALAAGATVDDVAAAAADDTDPMSDHVITAAYRSHLARVLTLRALREIEQGGACLKRTPPVRPSE